MRRLFIYFPMTVFNGVYIVMNVTDTLTRVSTHILTAATVVEEKERPGHSDKTMLLS